MLDNTKAALQAVSEVSDSIVTAAQKKIPGIADSVSKISPAVFRSPSTGTVNNYYNNS